MDAQSDFGTNVHLCDAQELVGRLGDAAVSRVFQRCGAVLGSAAIDFVEDGGDAADAYEFDAVPEAFDSGDAAVTVFRAEEGDLEHLLHRPGAAHHLPVDGSDRDW